MKYLVRESNQAIIDLGSGCYAIRFPYFILSERTLWMAIPDSLRLEIVKNRQQVIFNPETEETAGQHRANASEYERALPSEVAELRGKVEDLAQYIIIKVISKV
jgi:hypothetical protein